MAVVDPGPAQDKHIRGLVSSVQAVSPPPAAVHILLTHGHEDHAGAARSLCSLLETVLREHGTLVRVLGPGPPAELILKDGDAIETSEGPLVAVSTPGHARDHLCFHWPGRRALFAGDLILGEGSTTYVGEYPGCVADYLASLKRVEELGVDVIHPGHGPSIHQVRKALDEYRRHRLERVRQVAAARAAHPNGSVDELVEAVYGPGLNEAHRGAARKSVSAILHHLSAPEIAT